MTHLLNESTPSEQAKALGLTYGGFGGWVDSNRKVVAKTINGKLVRVEPDEDSGAKEDLGRLVIIDFDDELLYADLTNPTPTVEKYIHLLKSSIKAGNSTAILHARNSEKKVAHFLKKIGIVTGVTLVPYGSGDPNKKQNFVRKKINAGYREIIFLDRDPKALRAVEGLKAPFNKTSVKITTHQIPTVDPDAEHQA